MHLLESESQDKQNTFSPTTAALSLGPTSVIEDITAREVLAQLVNLPYLTHFAIPLLVYLYLLGREKNELPTDPTEMGTGSSYPLTNSSQLSQKAFLYYIEGSAPSVLKSLF